MKVKSEWKTEDFDDMGWHDCRIHAIRFSSDIPKIILDIDYIFKWELGKDQTYKFWVSPCSLIFEDALNVKIDLDFQSIVGLDISAIERQEIGSTPVGEFKIWKFIVKTDLGNIELDSTGFSQLVENPPVLSESQFLSR